MAGERLGFINKKRELIECPEGENVFGLTNDIEAVVVFEDVGSRSQVKKIICRKGQTREIKTVIASVFKGKVRNEDIPGVVRLVRGYSKNGFELFLGRLLWQTSAYEDTKKVEKAVESNPAAGAALEQQRDAAKKILNDSKWDEVEKKLFGGQDNQGDQSDQS